MSNYQIRKEKDYWIGLKNEEIVKDKLDKYFNTNLKSNPRYAVCDFENDDYVIEFKNRNNSINTYKTTLIGQNKIEYMKNKLNSDKDHRELYFVFNYTDGLYFIQITNEVLNKFDEKRRGGRNDRGSDEFYKNGYCYIPTNLLTKIELDNK